MAHRRPWSGPGDGAARKAHVRCTWGELVEWLGGPLSEPSPKLKLRKTFDVLLGKSGWQARSVVCTCAACAGGWIRPGDPWPVKVAAKWSVTMGSRLAGRGFFTVGCQRVPLKLLDAVLDARRRLLRKSASARRPVTLDGATRGSDGRPSQVSCVVHPNGTVTVGTWNASFSSADMRRLLRARRLLVAKTKAG